MSNARKILNNEEDRRVVEAIQQAERNTSGQIKVHIENFCHINVERRSLMVFKHLKMNKTKQRNGVLIYLAVKDHKFAILGDEGINKVVGNDFWNDVKGSVKDELLLVNKYLEKLPVTIVDGKEYCFVNGVGYGIDGYCCEEGDRQRALSDKPINYTSIAIKGLLFKFKSRTAKITVDGVVHEFKNAWLAPVMNGKFYGGGMKVAPDQDRLNKERTLTCVVMYDKIPLHALMIFPKIFKGELVNETKHVSVFTGKDITVEFDQPCAMQIDGETFLNISSTETHAYRD